MLPPTLERRPGGRKKKETVTELPKDQRPIQVACYVRISKVRAAKPKPGQEEASQEPLVLGAEAQRTALTAYLASRGLTPDDPSVRWYTDLDESGKTSTLEKRPALGELRAAMQRREVAHVVAMKLDRFTRSVVDIGKWKQECEDTGTGWAALDIGADTSTTTGKLIVNVLAAVAEYERERISERTADALEEKRKQGVRLGAVPLSEKFPWAPAEVVRMRQRGCTIEQMRLALWQLGLRNRKGRPIAPEQLYRLAADYKPDDTN